MRLTSDFFVSALIRQAGIAGAFAGLRRRGGAEAGAIFVIADRLDGSYQLFGPAPQSGYGENLERAFTLLHKTETVDRETIEARLDKEIRFDSDCWIVEIEDRQGRHFLTRVV
jgi:hypothetical protein